MLPSAWRRSEHRLSVRGADRPSAYDRYGVFVAPGRQLRATFGRMSSNFTSSLYGRMNSTAVPMGAAGANVTLPFSSSLSGARDVHSVPPLAPMVPELPLPPLGV